MSSSTRSGFLVVNSRTGFMLEGKDHAAKIFDTQTDAKRACKPLQDQVPVPFPYHHLASALIKGSAFCFESIEGHSKFLKCLRNDLANKPFLAYSQDRNFVRWRHPNEKPAAKTGADTGVVTDHLIQTALAEKPSVEAPVFNSAILVR